MTIQVDDAYLPATFTAPSMTDEEFAAFCALYPDYFIEMTAEGELLIMPPNYTVTSMQNGEIVGQLRDWNRRERLGFVTDSSGGFVLPNGARRSPDAAWVAKTQSGIQDRGYFHLCPEFVIELRSTTDRLPALRQKMEEWIANGARLAWLIDPERRAVEIYQPGAQAEIITGADSVRAGSPVDGFTLDLPPVWNPLG